MFWLRIINLETPNFTLCMEINKLWKFARMISFYMLISSDLLLLGKLLEYQQYFCFANWNDDVLKFGTHSIYIYNKSRFQSSSGNKFIKYCFIVVGATHSIFCAKYLIKAIEVGKFSVCEKIQIILISLILFEALNIFNFYFFNIKKNIFWCVIHTSSSWIKSENIILF